MQSVGSAVNAVGGSIFIAVISIGSVSIKGRTGKERKKMDPRKLLDIFPGRGHRITALVNTHGGMDDNGKVTEMVFHQILEQLSTGEQADAFLPFHPASK